MFDAFGEAATKFTRRKCVKCEGVHDDDGGLVEGADEVFALGDIDADFATDGGVDHSEEGGWALDKGDTAQVGGGGHADGVA